MKSGDCQVVIIVGAPRSGTSLLYKLLCTHPDVNYLSNWNRRFPRIGLLAALRRIPLRRSGRRDAVWFPGSNAYVAGHRALRERLFPSPVEADVFYACSGLHDLDSAGNTATASRTRARTRVERRLAQRLRAVMRWGGGSHLVLKCIANNAHLDTLVGAFPDARIIDITRDGRDVATSLATVDWWPDLELWWWSGTPRDWAAAGHDPIEACARHWVAEIERLRHALASVVARDATNSGGAGNSSGASRLHSLRYEDLVRDPARVLREVATHIGLDADATWVEQAAAVPGARERPNHAAIAPIVEQVQAGLLAELGYRPHEFSS